MKKFIFFLVLFLFMYLDVSAMEVILVKDRLDDNYVYYYDSNLGRERYLEANIYLFGSDVGYCLELGKSIESNIYQVVTSFEKLNISKEDLEYVKLVSYYGYDYPGHRTDNYYMAAQELIWDRLSGVNIKWVKDLNPSLALDVSKEKNEIVALAEEIFQGSGHISLLPAGSPWDKKKALEKLNGLLSSPKQIHIVSPTAPQTE